jgi:hypothetical protein
LGLGGGGGTIPGGSRRQTADTWSARVHGRLPVCARSGNPRSVQNLEVRAGSGMRFVFTAYLVLIVAGLAYALTIGFVNPS